MRKARNMTISLIVTLCIGSLCSFAYAAQKITIWQQYEPVPEIMQSFNDMYKEAEKKLNIDIQTAYIPQAEMHQKLLTSIAAGTYPDIVFWFGQPGIEFSHLGIICQVNDVVEEAGKEKWPERILKALQYPIGTQREVPFLSRLNGLHLWKDWFAKAGIDPEPRKDAQGNYHVWAVDTWDKLVDTAQKLNQDTNGDGKIDKWGLGAQYCRKAIGDGSDWAFSVFVGYGASIGDTTKKKITFDSPEAVKAVQLMKDIYWKYKIVPPQVTSWDEYANNLYFQNKTVAMTRNGNSIIPRLLKENPSVVPQVGMSIPPAGPVTRGTIATPMTWTIFKTKNAEASKKLVLYCLDKDVQLQLLKKMGKTGFYGPMRLDVLADPYFEKLPMTTRMCMETAKYEVGPAYPYPTTPEARAAYSSGIFVDILVRITVDNWSAEKAVKEAAEKMKEIMEH